MAWFAIAAAAVSAAQQMKEGQQAQEVGDYNAQVAENTAKAQEESAGYEAKQYTTKVRNLIATQRAETAASGLGLEGSPLDVMDETAAQGAYDALLIRHTGDVAAAQSRSQAALDRLGGKSAKTGSYYGAGGTFLTGASRLSQLYGTKT